MRTWRTVARWNRIVENVGMGSKIVVNRLLVLERVSAALSNSVTESRSGHQRQPCEHEGATSQRPCCMRKVFYVPVGGCASSPFSRASSSSKVVGSFGSNAPVPQSLVSAGTEAAEEAQVILDVIVVPTPTDGSLPLTSGASI